jgi:DNA-binding SARP family transcriptional activator
MAQIPGVVNGAESGYAQVFTHLKSAQAAADQLGDQATVALIEMLQRLCLSQARAADARALSTFDHTPQAEPRHQQRAPVASLAVHLFGPFQAFLNGSPVDGWRKKSGALFKYLIVHRATPVHRDQLLDVFWPDSDPQSARNCLNVTLHDLRRSLEPDGRPSPPAGLIQFADDRYTLHPDARVWTDADAFTEHVTQAQVAARHGNRADAIAHCEVAVTLYRSDFLEDDRYEDWTTSHRERLRTAYMALLTHLSQLYFEAGNYPAALDCSRKILERDNCYEDAHCQIMRCHQALGQRSLALRQYLTCRDTLARELGVPPMAATTRLYEQIKNGF